MPQPLYEELENKVRELEQQFSEQMKVNGMLRLRIRKLRTRVRVLNCLCRISDLMSQNYLPEQEIFQETVNLIPRAWQHSDKVCARIILKEKEYKTKNFSETAPRQSADIVIESAAVGKVEIAFTEENEDILHCNGNRLNHAVAERIARFADERETENVLRNYQDKLELQLLEANDDLKREIEVRKQTESALRESEEKHRIVLEAAPDPVAVCDMEERVTYINPAFTRVFGWTLDEILGRQIEFMPTEQLPETKTIMASLRHCEPFSGIETYRLNKEGHKVDVSISGSFFYDSQGEPMGSVLTFQDISERKRVEEEIAFIAYHDVLTGLPNRKSFYRCLEEKLNQSLRRIGDSKWALLFMDLDRFKYVNDTLGHDAGDELLKGMADRLSNCLRKSDHVFRLGGDEFTIILNNLLNDIDIAQVVSKIRKAVSLPWTIKETEVFTTASIGISVYPDDGKTVEVLVKNADMAMYVAKEEGDGYRFFTEEMNIKAIERMNMGNNLRTALERRQFIVYYQPLVGDVQQIVGAEALLRWQHPLMGLVNPDKFIHLAEETGIIVPIGEWVLLTACKQAKRWHDMGYKGLYVAVNLSTRQFREKNLTETIERILDETGLSPNYLKLEVTESGIMEDPEAAIAKMNRLRSKGIRFSIDDFGTGYSSLSYMKRFPIDTLKIDRSFIVESATNRDDREIIKTIISMARNLNIETVAEGVENKDQQDFLSSQGCRMMQGYYFGRPMPARELEDVLRRKDIVLKEEAAG